MTSQRFPSKRTGATLIEILVVIVIFTFGILAIAQIFPGGLGVLRTTRNNMVATNLARTEMDRVKGQSDQIAEAILSTRYQAGPLGVDVLADVNRRPNDIGPGSVSELRQNGDLVDGSGNVLGPWQYFVGGNVARRIVAEGRPIPSPRYIQGTNTPGSLYGGLMQLQFAPVFTAPGFNTVFVVYGNDLDRRVVEGTPAGRPVQANRDFVYFVNWEGTELALPQGPYRLVAGNPYERRYRVSFSYLVEDNTTNTVSSRDLLTAAIINVPCAAAGQPRVYWNVDLTALVTVGANETFVGLDVDSVRVARLFDEVTVFDTDPAFRDDAAYQYRLLDRSLGLVLFNAQGFNLTERRRRGRVPLQARVDYDVLDWRIIRDDLRIGRSAPTQQKLILNGLKSIRSRDADNLFYTGLGFTVPDGAGGSIERDFIVLDRETGGVFMPSSYRVDYGRGTVSFIDTDGNAANGITAQIVFPGTAAPTAVNAVQGRSVRALYMGRNEWTVQAQKPPTVYRQATDPLLSVGQFYVGGSNQFVGNDLDTRIYFPQSDIGSKVLIGEVWYRDAGGLPARVVRDEEFLVQAPQAGQLNLGYVDIRDKVSDAVAIDFSNGYSVRRVRGASMAIRVLWNPATLALTADPVANLRQFEIWNRNWRVSETETILIKGQDTP
ncbi:MAG TPA: hypothetical protein PLO61_00595 [Fimbriimonadaceae bacterium]|nr:hypothetical protein [Fimbriimonadaceae bacterium]HRJ32396.1 hypothetical protein [Fimbriimonadaceae bacterium]